MEEIKNQETIVEETMQQNEYQKYLDSINNLKATTVSRDKYDELAKENKTLLESIVNGQKYATAETDTTPKYTKEELVKKMLTPDIGAYDYIDAALKFRDLVIEETGNDPFVGRGYGIQPSTAADECAENTADVFKQCLDNCNGNDTLFIQGLQNRTNDVRLPSIKYKK